MDRITAIFVGMAVLFLLARAIVSMSGNSTQIANAEANITHIDYECVRAKLHSQAIGVTEEQGTFHWLNCGLRTNEAFCFEKNKTKCSVTW